MSIKSDKWIRRMAKETDMINPFVDGQVRHSEGGKVISYGTSSYGYDVRCANEFKIFTNINSVIVDPKNLDTNSFIDVQSDVCIIPPNSFALARTVEYFKIPRDVLIICVGKSTYARCFHGNTRVALLDGTAPTLEEMAKRADNGEVFLGYSINTQGEIIAALLQAPRYIGRDKLIEIILDSGESIFCTHDHEFLNRDGSMIPAWNLHVGSSLMPLYRNVERNIIHQLSNNHLYSTHQLAQEWQLRNCIHNEETVINTEQKNINAYTVSTVNKSITQKQNFNHSVRLNHKIAQIREVAGEHDVYCLTAPETGNFALEAGVFVSNCGIIVNVTPLEPCFSSDTEILTKNGWKYFNEIVIGSEVLTLNPQTKTAEWQQVEKIQAYTYRGDLLHFNSHGVDLLVTPDHSLYVINNSLENKNWHKDKAGNIFGKENYCMNRAVNWQSDDIEDTININGESYQSNGFLEFLGMYLSAGWCNINQQNIGTINIASFTDSDTNKINVILLALKQFANYNGAAWQLKNKALYDFVKPLGDVHETYIPQWIKELPAHRLQYLLKGLNLGEHKTFTYSTLSKALADDIQEIIFKAGFAASIYQKNIAQMQKQSNGSNSIKQSPIFTVRQSTIKDTLKVSPLKQKKVSYTNMVYDVTVANHIIFVRRNGKAVWSGNCWEGHVTLEFSNTTPLPAKIYANEGVAQLLFFGADEECETSYKDREGKYQGQTGITLPKA